MSLKNWEGRERKVVTGTSDVMSSPFVANLPGKRWLLPQRLMSMFMLFGRKRWSMVSVNAFSRPNWEGEDVLVKRTTMTVHRGLVHLRMTTLLALLPEI